MRTCFLLKVAPGKIDEYRERHAEVWPELQEALRETGWKNYSLFLRDDGLLVGYLEAENFAQCCAAMKRYSVNARWQAEMAPFFENLESRGPDDNMKPLLEIFHLD
jgi:L-rhamnose mutarotase